MYILSIVLVFLYRIQINLVLSQDFNFYDSQDTDFLPDGTTLPYASLSTMISYTQTYPDHCVFHLNNNIDDYMQDRLIIGQLSRINQIQYVQISFHNENDEFIRDNYGYPIMYTSTRQDLTHALDILHRNFPFSYAKFLLKFLSNTDFDVNSLFLHFTNESSNSKNQTGFISGPTRFSIDTSKQNYSVSINCSQDLTCMWLLDDLIVVPLSNTSIVLSFDSKSIGNRTLTYVAYRGNNPKILASLSLTILPSKQQVCSNILRITRNRWIITGDMSSPRVDFTVTRLPNSGYIVVAGGTSNQSTSLSTMDLFDSTLNCYNLSNLTIARMKHAAINYNNSDFILLLGGVSSNENLVLTSELISLSNSQTFASLSQGRSFPELVKINNSILIIAGQGIIDPSKEIEIYNRISSTFELWTLQHSDLFNIKGHSVTPIENSSYALIFGGYNDANYSSKSFLINTTDLIQATEVNLTISARAYHQSIFIPSINAIFITGGNNEVETFDSCYLYDLSSNSFNITGSMNQKRSFHTAVLLRNNSVLVIGGITSLANGGIGDILRTVERYDPNSASFTFIANLNIPRYRHRAIQLVNNDVCVFGGIGIDGNVLSSIECINS